MPDQPPSTGVAPMVFQSVITGTIEDVWHEITRTDAPIPAFFNAQMHVKRLEAGARLVMRTGNGKYTGVVGKVLECDAPRRFVHTFRFTNFEDPECVVAYDLEEISDGVRFTLTVTDYTEGTRTAKQMKQGGKMIVNTLKAVIETGRPALGTRMLFGLFRLLEPTSPKRCRSEFWSLDDDPNGDDPANQRSES